MELYDAIFPSDSNYSSLNSGSSLRGLAYLRSLSAGSSMILTSISILILSLELYLDCDYDSWNWLCLIDCDSYIKLYL